MCLQKADLERLAAETCERVLKGHEYAHGRVAGWTGAITSELLAAAQPLVPRCKLFVHCCVLQRPAPPSPAPGMHAASAAHWDSAADLLVAHRFDSPTLVALLQLVAIAPLDA
jgi:hypothetical protein